MLLTASVPIFLFVYIIFPSPASPLDKILTLGRTNKLVLLSLNRIFPGAEQLPLIAIKTCILISIYSINKTLITEVVSDLVSEL